MTATVTPTWPLALLMHELRGDDTAVHLTLGMVVDSDDPKRYARYMMLGTASSAIGWLGRRDPGLVAHLVTELKALRQPTVPEMHRLHMSADALITAAFYRGGPWLHPPRHLMAAAPEDHLAIAEGAAALWTRLVYQLGLTGDALRDLGTEVLSMAAANAQAEAGGAR